MSDLIKTPEIMDSKECLANLVQRKLPTRVAHIGDNLTIRRALPHRDKKTIGAWCFLDHFGPLDLKNSKGLDVAPHPHIGLQTFTWTIAGEILHKDSLGSNQVIHAGQVNLMTAGKGIAHSEESLPDSVLHGVQLWIALPDAVRHMDPNFIHYPNIPSAQLNGLHINVLAGDFLNENSPVAVYSPLMCVELNAVADATCKLPLNPRFEYGILPLIGDIDVGNETIDMSNLLYLGCGHSSLNIRMKKGAKTLIIGGEPFNEEILIWWNFVARSREEIIHATNAWNNHQEFKEVIGYQGPGGRLIAPPLPLRNSNERKQQGTSDRKNLEKRTDYRRRWRASQTRVWFS